MATMVSGQFTREVAPGLRKVFFLEHDQIPEQYGSIFNVEGSSRQYEDDASIAGVGALDTKNEGSSISYDSAVERYTKRYTHVTYAKGIRISEELWEDELYGVMKRMSQSLARAARHSVETVAATVFINGFSDTGPDGVSLFNTAHPKISGSQGNRPSTAADLSVTSLKAALTTFRGQTDDQGIILVAQPRLLVVHPSDEWLAMEILQSQNRPHTADNEVNVLRNRLELFVWDYLTDSDAWFIVGQKGRHQLNFFNRVKVSIQSSDDFDTGDGKQKARLRVSAGYSDWRMTYGSPGA